MKPSGSTKWLALLPAWLLVSVITLPGLALLGAARPSALAEGVSHPLFAEALWLSAWTSLISLVILLATGTPLAWWLARGPHRATRWIGLLVDLPIVIPPAVIGVALLMAFGRAGLLGPTLDAAGISLPFTAAAVVLAQVVVASPFYVQTATAAFRKVDAELMVVARTLGASPRQAFFRVALPAAWPGLFAGASLAWARALGEFGATLLFAGNLAGSTRTLPLAILTALESDVSLAVALSLVLLAVGIALLGALRLTERRWA